MRNFNQMIGYGSMPEVGYLGDELRSAAYWGRAEELRHLIRQGADIESRDSSGSTALLTAVSRSYPPAVQVLVSAGADINAADNYNDTPISVAREKGDQSLLNALTGGIGIGFSGRFPPGGSFTHPVGGMGIGSTSRVGHLGDELRSAAFSGNADELRRLIEQGADIESRNSHGETALHRAVSGSEPATAQILVEAGANVNARARSGDTPMSLAKNKPELLEAMNTASRSGFLPRISENMASRGSFVSRVAEGVFPRRGRYVTAEEHVSTTTQASSLSYADRLSMRRMHGGGGLGL